MSYSEKRRLIKDDSDSVNAPSKNWMRYGEENVNSENIQSTKLKECFREATSIPGIRFKSGFGSTKTKTPAEVPNYNFFKTGSGNKMKIFSQPPYSETREWIAECSKMHHELKREIAPPKTIHSVMKNFYRASSKLQNLIIRYVSYYAQCPVMRLHRLSGYGLNFFAPVSNDFEVGREKIFSKLKLPMREFQLFEELVKDNFFEEITSYHSTSGYNPILPTALGEFPSRFYFKAGDPIFGPYAHITRITGRDSVLSANLFSTIVSNSDYPLALDSPYNERALEHVEALTEEARVRSNGTFRDFNTISMPIGISEGSSIFRGGHEISCVLHLNPRGQVNGFIFNNTNRLPSKYSFYVYYLPFIKTLYYKNKLDPKLHKAVYKILLSMYSYLKKNNNGNFNFTNIKNDKKRFEMMKEMLSSREFDEAYEEFYNFRVEGKCMNYDPNLKFQGNSGFCLYSASQVNMALGHSIAKNGYPGEGKLKKHKSYPDQYHRLPGPKFRADVLKRTKVAYKEVEEEEGKYGSYSDLKIIYHQSRIVSERKADAIVRKSQWSEMRSSVLPEKNTKNGHFLYMPTIKRKFPYREARTKKNIEYTPIITSKQKEISQETQYSKLPLKKSLS